MLAKLLSDDSVREHVPHVLAELLKENTELQATAADADTVPKLALLLQQDNCSLRLKVSLSCCQRPYKTRSSNAAGSPS